MPKCGRKKVPRIYWQQIQAREEEPTIPIYDVRNDCPEGLPLPIELFRRFFSNDILDLIVDQSNVYATQTDVNKPLDLDRDELEKWLGLCMYMSISKISNTRLHWSGICLGNETVSSNMSRDRWETIKMKLHLVDNSQLNANDKVCKVKPLLDHLRAKFKEIPMTEYLSVDEQMVPYKGSSSLKQYIPNKPHKRGYKIFCLADDMGMVYDFFPYTGKIEPVNNPNVPDLNPSANSVLHLAECIPPFKNHKLYFDNWFTSLPLIDHLASRGIWCTGTVRHNRLPCLTFRSDKHLQAHGRGSYDEWESTFENNKVTAIKWFDNKSVHLASTFATSSPVDKCSRYDRKMTERVEVPRPFIVKDYNSHMGGVDLHDQLMSYYRMEFRSKKYYLRLIFHMIDMAVANSWLLYRRLANSLEVPQRKQMNLCEFKLKLCDSLLLSGKTKGKKRKSLGNAVSSAHTAKKKRGKATKPIPDKDIRLDKIDHFPIISSSRGSCKLPGCKGKISVFCQKCEVHLCLESKRNCFLEFHTK